MISLRMNRRVFDDLSRIAQQGGRTLSETARDALQTYVDAHPVDTSYPRTEHGSARSARKVSENSQATWADEDLRAALGRYEAACREAGMRDNAWRSYIDYARRFLAWCTGATSRGGQAQATGPSREQQRRPRNSVIRLIRMHAQGCWPRTTHRRHLLSSCDVLHSLARRGVPAWRGLWPSMTGSSSRVSTRW